jgi:hypothetical protein
VLWSRTQDKAETEQLTEHFVVALISLSEEGHHTVIKTVILRIVQVEVHGDASLIP